ncbi:Copper chaperone [Handroanthus impetiginosus]|uniref:Copper chaperone n=1 Tax=Handroanthus impetiginosus TaxID=429701 RepID=A0A2G9G7W6_9LAMI|nr:Copper chaperone [Handroanthus impetiginosus]
MDEPSSSSPSSSSSSVPLAGGRAIDRHNPIITDSRRIATSVLPPRTISHPPVDPNPQKILHQKKKKKNRKIPLKENEDGSSVNKIDGEKIKNSPNNGIRKGWSCTQPGDFISPPGSTRYLLRDKVLFNDLQDFDPPAKLVLEESSNSKDEESSKSNDEKTGEVVDAKPPSEFQSPDQDVILKVSLHCRGCERKLRKHLSRMEGVTSFEIEFAAKKVTVKGDITPLEVLSSISKVKNAQLWNPTIHSSSTPQSLNPNISEFKNGQKEAGA